MINLAPPVTSPPPLLPRDCHRISSGGRTAKGRWSSRVRATVRKATPHRPNQSRRALAGLRHLHCSSPAPGKLHPCVASRAAPRRHYRPWCWHRRRLLRVGRCTLPPWAHSLASEHFVLARNGGCEPLTADGDACHGPRAHGRRGSATAQCDNPPRKIPYYRLNQSTLVIKR
jgi:hypothetical protein